MSQPRTSNYRVIISGKTVEVYVFSHPIGYDLDRKQNPGEHHKRTDNPKIHASAIARTRGNVVRLINSNCFQWFDQEGRPFPPQFISFTFKDNVTDLDYANAEYTNFMKRLNYHFFDSKTAVAKYLTVVEFQKRGAVHFHSVFFNIPVMKVAIERKTRELAELWTHGFVDIKPIHSTRVGSYIAKYMTKDIDKRLIGRRRYFCSKGLHKPITITHEYEAFPMIKRLGIREKPVFNSNYRSTITGVTTYLVYELEEAKLRNLMHSYIL